MDKKKEVGVDGRNTMVTTLRGLSEDLHWKIQQEALKRKIAKKPKATANDIYIELIERGLKIFTWS